jgi:NADPH-dependent 2,4-dienoyl-CoA reductase/sulfur reductase-like enzyme
MEHLIIIGAAAAGTKAAAKARRENLNLKITLFTEEENISYSACGIPFYIGGEFDDYKKLIEYTPFEFEKEINAKVFILHKVLEIFPKKNSIKVKNLVTEDIFEEKYTKLLIATGAKPVKPPFDGIETKNIFMEIGRAHV